MGAVEWAGVLGVAGVRTRHRSQEARFPQVEQPVGHEPLQPRFAPERPGEVRRSCLDVTRAKLELGWEPAVELRDGLRTILAGL